MVKFLTKSVNTFKIYSKIKYFNFLVLTYDVRVNVTNIFINFFMFIIECIFGEIRSGFIAK